MHGGAAFDQKLFKLGLVIIIDYLRSSFINMINFIFNVSIIGHPHITVRKDDIFINNFAFQII